MAFRRLCRDFGADLAVTEMVSVAGLNYRGKKTTQLMRIAPNEQPSCVQLFGREPEQFERALDHPEVRAFDIIDVNMAAPCARCSATVRAARFWASPNVPPP